MVEGSIPWSPLILLRGWEELKTFLSKFSIMSCHVISSLSCLLSRLKSLSLFNSTDKICSISITFSPPLNLFQFYHILSEMGKPGLQDAGIPWGSWCITILHFNSLNSILNNSKFLFTFLICVDWQFHWTDTTAWL